MAKLTTFLTPREGGTLSTERGYPWTATIGDRRVKFVVQMDAHGRFAKLTHFASGMVFANIAGRILARAVNRGDVGISRAIHAPWSAAKIACLDAIDEVVRNHGVEFVLQKLSRAKVINR